MPSSQCSSFVFFPFASTSRDFTYPVLMRVLPLRMLFNTLAVCVICRKGLSVAGSVRLRYFSGLGVPLDGSPLTYPAVLCWGTCS